VRIVDDSAFYAERESDCRPSDVLPWIAKTMKENPTAVLNIIGNADSREAEPKDLGMRRAMLIRDSLVMMGIAAGRLVPTSQGDTRLLIDDHVIARMKTASERATARQRNRRVEFNIISFDWRP
jgi:outer membrane protein OmpA-like peptidoglycan-associated protein